MDCSLKKMEVTRARGKGAACFPSSCPACSSSLHLLEKACFPLGIVNELYIWAFRNGCRLKKKQ